VEINRIYNEDCMKTMARMPDDFIDLTVTSPPYDNLRTYKNDIGKTWGEHIWKSIIRELYRVTKKGGVVVWVVNDATIKGSETGTSFKQALWAIECGFNLHDTMIYQKTGCAMPSNRYLSNFEYMFVFSNSKPKTFNPIEDRKTDLQRDGEGAERSGIKMAPGATGESARQKNLGEDLMFGDIITVAKDMAAISLRVCIPRASQNN